MSQRGLTKIFSSFSKNRVFRYLKRPDEKMTSKSGNAKFSLEEKLVLAELGTQYPDIETKDMTMSY